ncbi:MAG: DCC1-like thiol-disulfide oxidoreductase family protein [Planctomycetota bacterium]|nr:DCC1-like thiol-disulfide oxidoreductase family protein [Planctomycetota bacterium]
MTIYYDGSCRICCAQRDRFLRHDPDQRRLVHVDVADPAFDPATLDTPTPTPTTHTTPTTRQALLASIHAGTPTGELVSGLAALRLAYTALGRGRLLAVTGWPVVRPITDALYTLLARNRHRFGQTACDDDTCRPKEP